MLTVITGLPGSGKTLYSLQLISERAAKENRAVYQYGIDDLKLDWHPITDPKKWPEEVPAGAIIVIDECQRYGFAVRPNGSAVPKHIEALETHRHEGWDIYLISQHPMMVDQNVRRLAGQHFHAVRTFGMQRATIHEWPSVKTDCDKRRKDSIRHEWSYPTKLFDAYKSAEVHTHKRRVPMRLWFLFAVPLIVGVLGYYGYRAVHSIGHPNGDPVASGASGTAMLTTREAPKKTPQVMRGEWLDQQVPRVEGLAYTAPIYDGATKPVRAPYPAACAATKDRCSCYSQQATRLDMPADLCRAIVAKGFFVAWEEKKPESELQRQKQPQPLSAEQSHRDSTLSFDRPDAAGQGRQGTRGSVASSSATNPQGSSPESGRAMSMVDRMRRQPPLSYPIAPWQVPGAPKVQR